MAFQPTGYLNRFSPRTRQWIAAAGLALAGFLVLYIVLAQSETGSAEKPAPAQRNAEIAVRNVMAPGQQVSDLDAWVGRAGRDLEQMKQEREIEARKDQQRQAQADAMMKRFDAIEQELQKQRNALAEGKATPSTTAAPVLPVPQPTADAFPPASAVLSAAPVIPGPMNAAAPPVAAVGPPRTGLPPMPTGIGTMPAGAPFTSGPLPSVAAPPAPAIVRVTLPSAAAAVPAAAAAVPPAPQTAQGTPAAQHRTVHNTLPVGFTRGVLLGGLDAPTGGHSQSNPHPVLIRLLDDSVLPNRYRGQYRECFVVAAGYGDIASERAYLRTESLTCVREDGAILDAQIQGAVNGEDGRLGMRGRLVSKQGQMLANALMTGILSGIGQGISAANTTYSTSAFGTVGTQSGTQALRGGIGSGVGRALDRLAQYYIKLAEQTFPIIEIDAGRVVDVVVHKTVALNAPPPSDARRSADGDPVHQGSRYFSAAIRPRRRSHLCGPSSRSGLLGIVHAKG